MSVEPYRDAEAIWVPKFAEGDDLVGVGYVKLTAADPDYDMWDRYLKVTTEAPPRIGRTPGGRHNTPTEGR